jgi:hypothetical protein
MKVISSIKLVHALGLVSFGLAATLLSGNAMASDCHYMVGYMKYSISSGSYVMLFPKKVLGESEDTIQKLFICESRKLKPVEPSLADSAKNMEIDWKSRLNGLISDGACVRPSLVLANRGEMKVADTLTGESEVIKCAGGEIASDRR